MRCIAGLSDVLLNLRIHNNYKVMLFSFFFSLVFIQICDSRKIHYLTCEFRVKLHLQTDIALIATRIAFRV